MSLFDRLSGAFSALIGKSQPRAIRQDRLIELMSSWSPHANATASYARSEYINHFRGWNYVAIKAIAEEIAGRAPSVYQKEDGREVAEKLAKSLRGKSHLEQKSLYSLHRKTYLSPAAKRKSLANLQDSDELRSVGKDHALVKLLRNPNGPDVAWTFWYKLTMFIELTGVGYIWCPPNATGKPSQLWVIPSHWVYDQPGETELIGSYEIRPVNGGLPQDALGFGGGWFPGMSGGSETRPATEIIKIAYPSPYSIIDGYAPVAAIATWIQVSNNIDSSRVQRFQNDGFPGVALEIEKDAAMPTDAEFERMEVAFQQKYTGVRNTGRPAILAPGFKIVPLGRTAVEMDYVNSADQSRGNLLSAHRVPQSIAGLVEASTYANAEAASYNFNASCIKPKLTLFGQVFTEKLARRWDDDLIVAWDDPMPNDPEFRLKQNETMYRNQCLTPNEWREDAGRVSWEHGGDDPVGNAMTTQPLGWATGDDPMAGAGGGMPGMGQPQQPGGDAGDPLAGIMGQLLGGDGADTDSGGGWAAAEKSINRIGASTNGKH